LVCRFSDLSYFLEGSVSKIFIEAELIFSNGSILAKEGALNVALMGSFYNIPVVIVGGSWAYNGWGPTNY
jgi:translation initiation factor 2B subunit (eIF-2B alpha/beta/delta family)